MYRHQPILTLPYTRFPYCTLVRVSRSGLAAGLGMVGGRWRLAAMRLRERRVLNGVDTIFVLSEHMRQTLLGQGVTTPIQVLPIWVDAAVIQPIEHAANGMENGREHG